MRRLAHVLVAVTSVLTALFVATVIRDTMVTAGGARNASEDADFARRMSFGTPLRSFTAAAKSHTGPDGGAGDTWFDWSTDFCSAPLIGNTGRSFNFTEPCRRHDFGYRNTKRLDERYGRGRYWNHDSRRRIDRQFLTDMKAHCGTRAMINVPPCVSWAYTFYGAVRAAGGP